VNIRSKLVALFLLLGLLASPAVAMAGCWGNAANGTAKPCEPHCPKMAEMMDKMLGTSSSSIRAGSAMSTCCSERFRYEDQSPLLCSHHHPALAPEISSPT
jgi:hypothetical protein